MEAIADILKTMSRRSKKFAEVAHFATLLRIWKTVAGTTIAQSAEVADYRQGIIYLDVTSSVWAQQLHFYKPTIIEKIKALAPEIWINDIRTNASNQNKALSPIEIKNARTGCPRCGEQYQGTGRICSACENSDRIERNASVMTYLHEAPWARFQDIQQDFQVPEVDFHRIKETVINKTTDTVKRLYYEVLEGIQPKAKLRNVVHKLTMLKTGLTPDKINDNIVKTIVSSAVYRCLNEG